MSTLFRIPAGHMRFVPAHMQSDEANPSLSPAKWPVELVLIANEKGRETFICHDRIQRILRPAIQATYFLTDAQTLFFPTPPLGRRLGGRLTPLPKRPLPKSPGTSAQSPPLGPAIPPCGPPSDGPTSGIPTQRLDTHLPSTYPMPPREPTGIGTTHEVAAVIRTSSSPTIHEPKHSGRGYTSSQQLPNMENTPAFLPQSERRASPSPGEAPAPYPWTRKFLPEQ